MKKLLIRDDDIGFFTEPERFRTVHRILLENGLPFNAAVVPSTRADIRSADGSYEGFIPKRFQGKNRLFPVHENRALVSFFRKLPGVEIAQHGFSHEKSDADQPEFAGKNIRELEAKMDRGARMLEKAFGRKPNFFVPPYDTVSRPVLEAVRRRYRGISMSRISKHLLPLPLWPKHLIVKKTGRFVLNWGGFRIFQHPGIDLSFDGSLEDARNTVRSCRDVYVLVIHSWNFFTPEGRLKSRLLENWEKMLRYCMEDASVRFMTFSELADFWENS